MLKMLEMGFPLEFSEGMQSCGHLDFNPVRTYNLQNYKIISLWIFKPLYLLIIYYSSNKKRKEIPFWSWSHAMLESTLLPLYLIQSLPTLTLKLFHLFCVAFQLELTFLEHVFTIDPHIHGFCTCEFTYLLKFICRITFTDTCKWQKSSVTGLACFQLRSNKAMLCFLVSVLTL